MVNPSASSFFFSPTTTLPMDRGAHLNDIVEKNLLKGGRGYF